jgi:hypothetical protein
MSSALAMVLMAAMAVPGNGPEKVLGEVEQRLDLRGQWEGMVSHIEGKLLTARLGDGILFELDGSTLAWGFDGWEFSDEGAGRFRLLLSGMGYQGIYKWEGNRVTLSYRPNGIGRTTSFRAGDGQHLIILHRVKPRK